MTKYDDKKTGVTETKFFTLLKARYYLFNSKSLNNV